MEELGRLCCQPSRCSVAVVIGLGLGLPWKLQASVWPPVLAGCFLLPPTLNCEAGRPHHHVTSHSPNPSLCTALSQILDSHGACAGARSTPSGCQPPGSGRCLCLAVTLACWAHRPVMQMAVIRQLNPGRRQVGKSLLESRSYSASGVCLVDWPQSLCGTLSTIKAAHLEPTCPPCSWYSGVCARLLGSAPAPTEQKHCHTRHQT